MALPKKTLESQLRTEHQLFRLGKSTYKQWKGRVARLNKSLRGKE